LIGHQRWQEEGIGGNQARTWLCLVLETLGILDRAEDEVHEAADEEYNEGADAHNHSGVGYKERGDGRRDKAVPAGLNQQMDRDHEAPITPNLDTMWRNIEGPNAKGDNHGPNTGGGGNNRPTPGGSTDNHVDNNADEGAFLSNGTYLTKFYDKLIFFGIQSSQVCMLMQNGITSPSKFAIYFNQVALDELLSGKDNGLKTMPKIVQQKLRGLH